MNQIKETFTVAEVAQMYKVSKNTIWNWIRTNKLPAVKSPTGRYVITEDYLKKQGLVS